jgi:hypothetical protein
VLLFVDSVDVNVTIQNVNAKPIFTDGVGLTRGVAENEEAGYLVAKIDVYDEDSGDDGQLILTMVLSASVPAGLFEIASTVADVGGTVRVFEQDVALEDAIGSHTSSLEALAGV